MSDTPVQIDINNDLIHQAALMYHHIKDDDVQVEEFIKWVNDILYKYIQDKYSL